MPLPGLTWAQTAKRLEDLGFSNLVMPDHFDEQLAVGPGLAAAAAATTALRFSAFVYGNDYRHPVMVAKEVATLDVLSGGRMDLGLGAGWKRVDYAEAGMQYDPPGVRVDRMVESLHIIRALFEDGPVTFEGEHYTIRGLEGLPKPVQSPVPVAIGGGGRRMLTLAGRHADIVGVNANLRSGEIGLDAMNDVLGADRFDTKLEWVREGAGDRFDQLVLNVLIAAWQITGGGQATTEAHGSHCEHVRPTTRSLGRRSAAADRVACRDSRHPAAAARALGLQLHGAGCGQQRHRGVRPGDLRTRRRIAPP